MPKLLIKNHYSIITGTMLDLPYVYNGNHVTELEKFTRKKVGAMAAMSAEIDFDLPGSTNNVTQTQTQTTTTTMTTTTTVTTTTTNGSTHHSPAGDSDMLKLSQSSAKTNVLVSPGVPEIDFNASKKLVSPGQGNSKRSIGPLDAAEDGEDCTDIEMTGAEVDESVPRLTVTTPQHEGIMSPDQQIPGSASLSSPVTCVSPSSPQAMKDMQRDAPRSPTSSASLSPSTSSASMSSQSSDPRRKRAKSVHTTEDFTSTATDNNPERGMACDNSAWTQAEEQDNQDTSDPVVDVTTELNVPEASPAPVSVLVTTPASASMFAVPDGLTSPDDDMEEAKKVGSIIWTHLLRARWIEHLDTFLIFNFFSSLCDRWLCSERQKAMSSCSRAAETTKLRRISVQAPRMLPSLHTTTSLDRMQ